MFSNLTAIFSDYTFNVFEEGQSIYADTAGSRNGVYNYDYYSRIRNYGIKYDFDFPISEKHYLRFGVSDVIYQFSPGVGVYKEEYTENNYKVDTSVGKKNIPANELFLYVEDEVTIGSKLKVNVGAHLSTFQIEGKSYFSIGLGCTGGQHRSVFMAGEFAKGLAEMGWQVSIRHRELERRGIVAATDLGQV